MTQGTSKIHSENILPIIKKWLYTNRDIFLRELVSNAYDAMSKLKILRDQGEAKFSDDELRIDIEIDKEKKALKIFDTGLGMTNEEVKKYIAQLAFSGVKKFVKKYKDEEGDAIIGHFCLGFYSSFMVSLSYKKEAKPAHLLCDEWPEYLLEEGARSRW